MQNHITPHLRGYRDGLRQPCKTISILTRSVSSHAELKKIDEWLEKSLEMEMCPEPGYVHETDDVEAEKARSLVWRILLIGRYFQKTVRIPVFDTGFVVEVKRYNNDSSQWQAKAIVPWVDGMPEKGVDHAYSSAANLMTLLQDGGNSLESPVAIYNFIQKKVLPPLRSMTVAGVSTIPILEAAYQCHIPFRHIGSGIYQLGWGSKGRLIDRSSVDSDSIIGAKLTTSKVLTARLLRVAGLPSPVHVLVNSREQAVSAAETLGWPLVVKPADKERGEGVTVSITDKATLSAAYKNAASFSRQILVEREVPGVCYRLLIANGKMLYAIRRGPKSIEGDGKRTISELVHSANLNNNGKPPWLQEKSYPMDKQAQEVLSLAGFNPDSVPDKGVWVPLRKIESTAWGGHIEDVSEKVHPENRQVAEKAVRLFGLDNAGIDIISTDIAQPWYENGAIINEVNYAPYFGGNDIARSLIPAFLEKLMRGDGRIPIEVVVGSDAAMEEARFRQQKFIKKNVDCYLTNHKLTLTPSGEELTFPFRSLFNRVAALLTNKSVEALVMIVQTDEFLKTGVPVDNFDRLIHIDNEIVHWEDSDKKASSTVQEELFQQLQCFEHKDDKLKGLKTV